MPRLNVGIATLLDRLIVDHKSLHEYDDIENLLDGKKLEKIVEGVYSSPEGGASYPPLIMFKAMFAGVA